MRWTRYALVAIAGTVVAGVAAPSRLDAAVGSNDYTVSTLTNAWEQPPAGATTVTITSSIQAVKVTLPFTFSFFGEPYSDAWVTTVGYLQFGASSNPGAQSSNQDFSQYTSVVMVHGIVAPLWDNLYHQGVGVGSIRHWTTGTAPNRRWTVAWIDYGEYNSPSARYQFQAKLYEGSNRIDFAYKPETIPTTWVGASWSMGINCVATNDPRYVCPVNSLANNTGHPPGDYRFDPRIVDYTGKVQFERLVPSASGFGTTTVAAPHSGGRVDLRRGATFLATTNCDADGNFAFHVQPGSPTLPGTLVAIAENAAAAVKDPAAAPYEFAVGNVASLQTSAALGTLTVTQSADAPAAFRGPANVARAAFDAWSWVTSRTSETVPQVPVWLDASTAATTYHRDDGNAPTYVRIGGANATNPDVWDDPVVRRVYGRHVLASVAAPMSPGVPVDSTFDAPTSEENAFAEAFGYWLGAAMTGDRIFVDGLSPSLASTRDLEDPQPAASKGPSVVAWVAAALFDLADLANETEDRIDGTGAELVRPLTAAAAVTQAPRADRFYRAWYQTAGFPAGPLSRDFVHHGLLGDDAFEQNDESGEARDLGAVPVRPASLVLNFDAEDWFSVTSPGTPLGLVAEMSFQRATYPADIHMQILGPAGQVLAEKLDTGLSFVTAATGPAAAGTYKVRVRHARGEIVASYSLQITHKLEVPTVSLPAWTAGRPYSQPFTVAGGAPPYNFTVQPSNGLPPGIALNAVQLRASGTPTQPGNFDFIVIVDDAGVPAHQATTSHHITIAPVLDLALAEFIAFAAGKAADVTYQHAGGTAPVVFHFDSGALPPGLAMDEDRLRFHGTPAAPGSATAHISGLDVAGSGDETDVTAVVCVAMTDAAPVAPLAEGDAACGFWFDAVAGSRAALSAATVKGQPKRAVRAAVFGPGGAAVENAALKPGNGKASATFDAPVSGRYFVVVASAAGAATQMSAKLALAAPKKGAGALTNFGAGGVQIVTLGALAGATLSFKATPDKATGVTANVLALLRPDGSAVPLGGLVTQKGANVSLAATLDRSGTWTVRLRGQGGQDGGLRYSYKLKQPKGVLYSAE